jgi:hypothetical protein
MQSIPMNVIEGGITTLLPVVCQSTWGHYHFTSGRLPVTTGVIITFSNMSVIDSLMCL